MPHGGRQRRPHDRLPHRDLAATMVLQNNVVIGSVNANKRTWDKAGQVLGVRRPRVARPADHPA